MQLAFRRILARPDRWLHHADPSRLSQGGSVKVIDVVIPARNEAHDLNAALRSVLMQQDVSLNVLLVNDHSSDQTPQIAAAIAQQYDRLTIIHDPPLRDGWFGKANAMQHGWERSSAATIVFTDADVVHHPQSCLIAQNEIDKRCIDFLSLFPKVELVSFWENIIVPPLLIAGMVWHITDRIDDPDSADAVAAGAFMMMRREVLDRIGGLEQVKQESLDDVQLSRQVKRHGFRTGFCFAPELIQVRLFKSNRDAFWGFTKNILASIRPIVWALPLMFLPAIIFGIPLLSQGLGLMRGDVLLFISGFVAYLLQAALLISARRLCEMRLAKAICFPLVAAPVFCCFASALYHHWRTGTIRWRGRSFQTK